MREIIVDPTRFSTDGDLLSGYLEPGTLHRGLLAAVFPRNREDIRSILEVARSSGLAVYTPVPWGLNPAREGVVLDFKFMSDILGIDTRNLFLDIEPGVTWEQVLPVLAERGSGWRSPPRRNRPTCSRARSSARWCSPLRGYPTGNSRPSTCFSRTGGSTGAGRTRSPVPSRTGGRTAAPISAGCSPVPGTRSGYRCAVTSTCTPSPRTARWWYWASRTGPRPACLRRSRPASEIGTEVVVVNRHAARRVLGEDPGLSTWSVVFGLEGPPALVAYHEKRLGQLASELKLKPKTPAGSVAEAFSAALGRPWYAPELSIGFYTNFERIDGLSALCEASLKEKGRLAQMVIPVKRGASVYVQHDLQEARGGNGAEAAIKSLLPGLSDAGAFFPDATGPLATHVFSGQPEYFELLKKVKGFMDPEDILNSGQVVEV